MITRTPLLLALVGMSLAACATSRETSAPPVAATEPPGGVDCGAEIPGLEDIVRPGRVVMLGELHGTREIPRFVGDVACHAARRGVPVRLGLEIPRGDRPALARFIAGPGDAAARTGLLASEHWQRPDQDGRSSEAMLALIDRVRALRSAGLDVDLFAFDIEAPTQEWNERDAAMAAAILEHAAAEPGALVLTLSGNLHNRTRPGLPWDPSAVPMGVHVRGQAASALSLDVRYVGGSAWICQESCGRAEVGGSPEGEPRRIALGAPDEHGHDGVYAVGAITAAAPAVAPDSPP